MFMNNPTKSSDCIKNLHNIWAVTDIVQPQAFDELANIVIIHPMIIL